MVSSDFVLYNLGPPVTSQITAHIMVINSSWNIVWQQKFDNFGSGIRVDLVGPNICWMTSNASML